MNKGAIVLDSDHGLAPPTTIHPISPADLPALEVSGESSGAESNDMDGRVQVFLPAFPAEHCVEHLQQSPPAEGHRQEEVTIGLGSRLIFLLFLFYLVLLFLSKFRSHKDKEQWRQVCLSMEASAPINLPPGTGWASPDLVLSSPCLYFMTIPNQVLTIFLSLLLEEPGNCELDSKLLFPNRRKPK